jgi:hypothetical protein
MIVKGQIRASCRRSGRTVSETSFSGAFAPALTITEAGLTLGAGTVLARMTQGAPSYVAFDGMEPRILALLTVAFGKSVPSHVIANLRRAAEQWSRGDKCLAHMLMEASE